MPLPARYQPATGPRRASALLCTGRLQVVPSLPMIASNENWSPLGSANTTQPLPRARWPRKSATSVAPWEMRPSISSSCLWSAGQVEVIRLAPAPYSGLRRGISEGRVSGSRIVHSRRPAHRGCWACSTYPSTIFHNSETGNRVVAVDRRVRDERGHQASFAGGARRLNQLVGHEERSSESTPGRRRRMRLLPTRLRRSVDGSESASSHGGRGCGGRRLLASLSDGRSMPLCVLIERGRPRGRWLSWRLAGLTRLRRRAPRAWCLDGFNVRELGHGRAGGAVAVLERARGVEHDLRRYWCSRARRAEATVFIAGDDTVAEAALADLVTAVVSDAIDAGSLARAHELEGSVPTAHADAGRSAGPVASASSREPWRMLTAFVGAVAGRPRRPGRRSATRRRPRRPCRVRAGTGEGERRRSGQTTVGTDRRGGPAPWRRRR